MFKNIFKILKKCIFFIYRTFLRENLFDNKKKPKNLCCFMQYAYGPPGTKCLLVIIHYDFHITTNYLSIYYKNIYRNLKMQLIFDTNIFSYQKLFGYLI